MNVFFQVVHIYGSSPN